MGLAAVHVAFNPCLRCRWIPAVWFSFPSLRGVDSKRSVPFVRSLPLLVPFSLLFYFFFLSSFSSLLHSRLASSCSSFHVVFILVLFFSSSCSQVALRFYLPSFITVLVSVVLFLLFPPLRFIPLSSRFPLYVSAFLTLFLFMSYLLFFYFKDPQKVPPYLT